MPFNGLLFSLLISILFDVAFRWTVCIPMRNTVKGILSAFTRPCVNPHWYDFYLWNTKGECLYTLANLFNIMTGAVKVQNEKIIF